jgi:tetraacyldisaccharide 4'-kinase
MGLLRKILFPLAILYGLVTAIRNLLYDKNILKSARFDVPVIAVGNLSVGGTGKTPMIEYLVRILDGYSLAVLSRGYKRKTQGFRLADATDSPETIGDEPFQFYKKFPQIKVAVDADRKRGIRNLLDQPDAPRVILLDDAFQHRRVKAGLYVLLTSYDDLYSDDFMLPTGNLREGKSGARRAQLIVVTKCPPDLSEAERDTIRKKLKPQRGQHLSFATIGYAAQLEGPQQVSVASVRGESKLVLAGIAKPQPFFDHVASPQDTVLRFPDHHAFTEMDVQSILSQANDRKIVTTEKDFVRLDGKLPKEQLYHLPIETIFLAGKDKFDQTISGFVAQAR